MIDRQNTPSPWSQTMSRIHSSPVNNDTESVVSNSHLDKNTSVKIMPLRDEDPNAPPTPRKRNNSLIPVELMMNNSGEGGRECAALATVFGVPEYIESKIFWERQQYQHEGLLPKKQINPLLLRPTTPSSTSAENSKYGYVSVNGISVVSRSLSAETHNEDEDVLLQGHHRSKFFISSYVDSVLDPVGSNELLKPAFLGATSASAPIPTPTKSFSLPHIPTVSKFNDILIEDENGVELMFPANPSSILIHSTPILRSGSMSSVQSAYTLPSQSNNKQQASNVDEDDESLKANTRVAVIIGMPEIFDLIVSDEDERFIIWGPDPIVLSSSMATTTTPERPSSYATLYNNQHTRPELKGFSSNTTSTLVRSKSIQTLKNNNGSRPNFASVRLSAQHWSESLKLARPTLKHSASANDQRTTATTTHGSLLLKKAFGLTKNNKIKEAMEAEKKSMMDIPKVIEAATIHKLVEKLTITLDYTFMTDFFLTYRDFLDSTDLCQLLVSRFYWALENDEESRRIVRIRTFVVLRHWLNNYFVHDFIGNRPLRIILTEFLNRLPRHPLVQTSPRDQRIVKILKRVVRRLKKLYYNRSSGASRVKVIAPPPPTAEQEQMGEIVRAKLSQNVIRRKTALGVDMSSHHNGNMAVQDARYAPVVVVGSLNMKGSFIDSGVDSSHNFSKLPFITQQPTQDSSDVMVVDDSQTIRSSVHHRYDKSVHQPVEAEVGHETKAAEASSVASVASDDSLESELSAGETAPLESDDSEDEDHPLHLGQEYYAEDDEHDREWIREQQETLEYFNSASKMALDQSAEPHNAIDTTQLQQQDDICEVLTESPTSIHPVRPKIPSEFIKMSKEVASTAKPAAHSIANSKTVRRVPSERWCKADDDHPPLHADHALPDELLRELSGDELQSKSPTGLSRKLSRKSIERRKSERSFHDATSPWHSAPSSAATSPYLTGAHSDDQVPEVPELPPLTPEMLDQRGMPKKRVIKKKKSGLKKKSNTEELANEAAIEAFASIPYEATQVAVKANDQEAKNGEQPKRRLSTVLSKVFRPTNHHDEDKHAKETTAGSSPSKVGATEEQKMQEIPTPQQQEQQQEHQQPQSSQWVSLIAQRLRHSSIDENDDSLDEVECGCVKCSGNSQGTSNCKRLSVILIADEERRRSFELRRKRGASIDMDQQAMINHLGIHTNDQKSPKEIKSGPVYLGHLQARSLISSAVGDGNSPHDSSGSEDEDDASTASFVPSERSIRTEAQASSSRARMSFISEAATSHVPRSKMIELGFPPESSTSLEKNTTRDTLNPPPSSIPRSMPEQVNMPSRFNGRCFIMSYRTSMLASQLCFIERDVLIKVGWEELIHCKWTKMDSSGNINTTPIQDEPSHSYDEGYDDEKINYTRQTEQRRTEEQGIEQVIQRFNIVCQWVSSEIVRTRNMNERVKLIEKFIRLAKKCKMYSNYATLVQILLGLQSPAVARLEKTWSKVSTKCQKLLSQLTEFTSPMKNWKNIRDSMTEVAEEYGNSPAEVQVEMPGTTANRQKFKKTTRIKIPFGGCIPFLGIYLSDLVFNSEKPRFLKPNLESQRIYSVNNTRNLPPCLDQPLVNFRKHRVIATVIKRVLTFQGLAMRYSFDEDGILLEKCRNLQVLDAAKIRDLSASLE
ncbi:UDP-glucuronic acid decarboxylase 1 [Mucor velutinosus]|uniref:UDP-glucuronic acid decarboxylase 1 n=1 Tax=Mucor velutinosus TaxID=708070 RepID=A0AAN7HYZ7_9FUNG|nr:UDP-glucuronic acid decarboxylase 1 [Mucor velutinosus]